MPLTQRELNKMGCETSCFHDHSQIFFNPRCHPKADVEACYDKASGTVVITCGRCHRFVVDIAVAAAGPTVQ